MPKSSPRPQSAGREATAAEIPCKSSIACNHSWMQFTRAQITDENSGKWTVEFGPLHTLLGQCKRFHQNFALEQDVQTF